MTPISAIATSGSTARTAKVAARTVPALRITPPVAEKARRTASRGVPCAASSRIRSTRKIV